MNKLDKQCDICKLPIKAKTGNQYIDAATTNGQWANMCVNCAQEQNVRFGTGRGQLFIFISRLAEGRQPGWRKLKG